MGSVKRLVGGLVIASGIFAATVSTAGSAQFPGTNGKFLFDSGLDGGLWTANLDGTGIVSLVPGNNSQNGDAAWSPFGGEKIVFKSDRFGVPATYGPTTDIFVVNADGSGLTRLTTTTSYQTQPSWSPDGSKIVFTSYRDGDPNIYVMNVDGSGLTQLTNNAAVDEWPSWSPNGAKIVFRSQRNGQDDLYLMDPDGQNQTRLTTDPSTEFQPTWSPDGLKIAFCSQRDGNEEIYMINADGTNETRITNNSFSDQTPEWSPDGTLLAFGSSRSGKWSIWTMNVDGTNQTLRVAQGTSNIGGASGYWQSISSAPTTTTSSPVAGSGSDVSVPAFTG
jgi:Tol biopolymer transport system component